MAGKWIGAVLIMAACGGYGFSLAHHHLILLRLLRQLQQILDRMEWELQYRLKPMPELCRLISSEQRGVLGNVFLRLAVELENQILPDGRSCMCCVLGSMHNLPPVLKRILEKLGDELGRYDLHGQLEGIDSVRQAVKEQIQDLERDKHKRIQGYKTLGLCAGAALIILFI